MTPFQYAKSKFIDEGFPDMTIQHIAGSFYIGDTDHKLLKGPAYTNRVDAVNARSKAMDRARKYIK